MSTAVGHKGNFIAGELGSKFVLIVADAVGMSVITNEAHDDYAEGYVNDGDDDRTLHKDHRKTVT